MTQSSGGALRRRKVLPPRQLRLGQNRAREQRRGRECPRRVPILWKRLRSPDPIVRAYCANQVWI